MSNLTIGKKDRVLIIRETVMALSYQQQWQAQTTDNKSAFIEIYCKKIRISFSGDGENVFMARENAKSNQFDFEIELANENNLTLEKLITLLDDTALLTEIEEK